jgi:hypothetical protein
MVVLPAWDEDSAEVNFLQRAMSYGNVMLDESPNASQPIGLTAEPAHVDAHENSTRGGDEAPMDMESQEMDTYHAEVLHLEDYEDDYVLKVKKEAVEEEVEQDHEVEELEVEEADKVHVVDEKERMAEDEEEGSIFGTAVVADPSAGGDDCHADLTGVEDAAAYGDDRGHLVGHSGEAGSVLQGGRVEGAVVISEAGIDADDFAARDLSGDSGIRESGDSMEDPETVPPSLESMENMAVFDELFASLNDTFSELTMLMSDHHDDVGN